MKRENNMPNETSYKSYYVWDHAGKNCSHSYLLPKVLSILGEIKKKKGLNSIFDLGCGNGSVANDLAQKGFTLRGIDASKQGIYQARKAYPKIKLDLGSAYSDLKKKYGQFEVVLSLEVVEHLFDPKLYAKNMFNLVQPGGYAILSTPFHGYFKNLALSITGKWDGHFTVLRVGGHIKFWSVKTLSRLLFEAGFAPDFKFYFVGRVPFLAKSMIVVAQKPIFKESKVKF